MSETIISGRELEPSRLFEPLVETYDVQAQQEFLDNRKAVEGWIDARFGELGLDTDKRHSLALSLKPYNRSDALGIQSVNFVVRRDDNPLRLVGAFKDSTLGVVAPDLLDSDYPVWDVVGFPVAQGSAERLHQLSPYLKLDSRPKDRVNKGRVKTLRGVMDVIGPNFAVTVLQRKRKPEERRGGGRRSQNHGVYACDYLNLNEAN